MIVHEDGKWVLKTKDGSKVLGTHATKEEAEAQERAVEAHKHSDSKERFNIDAAITINRQGAHILASGWLKAPANITKSGIFTYKYPDGSVVRRLRPPEEVFAADSLKSFEMVPITDGHPTSPLDASNTRLHQIGHLGEKIERNGNFVTAHVMITDSKAVQQILDGEKIELSCGYFSKDVDQPGNYNGEKYDSIQQVIRGNHVALLRPGLSRGGPDLRIKLDSNTQSVVTIELPPEEKGKTIMATFKVDGVDFEVSEQAAQAFARETAKQTDARTALTKQLEDAKSSEAKATAKADSLDADLKKAQDALKQAQDPVKAREIIKARVALETTAAGYMGADFKADALDDNALKAAVIEMVTGKKPARNDAAYIDAAFDFATAKESPFKKDGVMVRADLVNANESGVEGAKEARTRMIKELETQSKRAPGAKA